MDFFWAIKFFDTYWFMEHENKDPLEDLEFIRFFTQKLTGKILEEGAESLSKSLSIFRDSLYTVIQNLQKGIFDEETTLQLLSPYISGAKGTRKILSESDHQPATRKLVFEPEKVDEAYVLSEFATLWYILLFEKDRTRIRICEHPECSCLFIDESKNHSKRHCTDKCSNVMKMRRHREKKE